MTIAIKNWTLRLITRNWQEWPVPIWSNITKMIHSPAKLKEFIILFIYLTWPPKLTWEILADKEVDVSWWILNCPHSSIARMGSKSSAISPHNCSYFKFITFTENFALQNKTICLRRGRDERKLTDKIDVYWWRRAKPLTHPHWGLVSKLVRKTSNTERWIFATVTWLLL